MPAHLCAWALRNLVHRTLYQPQGYTITCVPVLSSSSVMAILPCVRSHRNSSYRTEQITL